MARVRIGLFAKLAFVWLCATAMVVLAFGQGGGSQSGLKTIDNPGGGQIVYGPVSGQTTLQGAMGAMLRNVHSHFGERPQIGRFFQAGGSDSVATFFTVTA